jgi:hypothetical protein
MNLEILHATLPANDNPGIDTLDPRWSELSALAQAGHFREAADMSQKLWQEGCHDLRLVGYLCFGHFLDGGPAALASVFAALATSLDGNWDALGPADGRARAAAQSFGWLFKQALKVLQHGEQTRDETWQAWLAQLAPEQLEEAQAGAFLLQQAIEPRLDKAAGALLEALGTLQAWLRGLAATVAPRAPAPSEPAPAAEPEAPAAAARPAAGGDAAIAGSYALTQLLRKIDALATLLEQDKLVPARIVADDVNDALARFDPFLYLPALFARFARLMAQHAGRLAELELDPESPAAKALRALYLVDLDGFLALDAA